MNEIREVALKFEAVKVGMRQNKEGTMLTLSIHPQEVPPELMAAWVGSRYVCALVRLDDQDQPADLEENKLLNRLVTSAALLCRQTDFWHHMSMLTGDVVIDEGTCAATLREYLGIKSRADIKTNKAAREAYQTVRKDYWENK